MSRGQRVGTPGRVRESSPNAGLEDEKFLEPLGQCPDHSILANILALRDPKDSLLRELIAAGVPLAMRIPRACALTELGRTTIYEAIKDDELHAHKRGDATLIFIWDLVEFLRRLPRVQSANRADSNERVRP